MSELPVSDSSNNSEPKGNTIIQELKETTLKFLNAFTTYSDDYSVPEKRLLNEYIIKITTTIFKTPKEVLTVIQDFISVSKYNLKRSSIKKQQNLVFVCSCNSPVIKKREQLPRRSKRKASFSQRSFTFGKTPKTMHQSDQDWLKPLPLKQRKPSNKQDENNCKNKSKEKHHRVRRNNKDACKFRLNFKIAEDVVTLTKFCKYEHNHPPFPGTSIEFREVYRNLKFPLDMVTRTFKDIYWFYYPSQDEKVSPKKTLPPNCIKQFLTRCLFEYKWTPTDSTRTLGLVRKKVKHFVRLANDMYRTVIRKYKNKALTSDECFRLIVKYFVHKSCACYLRLEDVETLYKMSLWNEIDI